MGHTSYAAFEVFRQGLRKYGWREGQNLTIAWRYADGPAERLLALAADLVRLPVDVRVTHGLTIRPAQHTTQTIPIVMAIMTDPVGSGLVASLARPEGNLTGFSIGVAELGGKRLELLLQAVPQASRLAVLWNAALIDKVPEWQGTQTAVQTLEVALHSVEVRGPDDFEGAFATLARERPDALITFADPLTRTHHRRIVAFATQHRLAMISELKAFTEARFHLAERRLQAGAAAAVPCSAVSWRSSRYGLAVIRRVFRPVLLRSRPIQIRSLPSAAAPISMGVISISPHNTFGVMMASPFTVVKGDKLTRLTPAGIIRCLQVQDLKTAIAFRVRQDDR